MCFRGEEGVAFFWFEFFWLVGFYFGLAVIKSYELNTHFVQNALGVFLECIFEFALVKKGIQFMFSDSSPCSKIQHKK